jgi:hypothetical protein
VTITKKLWHYCYKAKYKLDSVALRRLRQEVHEFTASLGYRVDEVWAVQQDPFSKQNNDKIIKPKSVSVEKTQIKMVLFL